MYNYLKWIKLNKIEISYPINWLNSTCGINYIYIFQVSISSEVHFNQKIRTHDMQHTTKKTI